MPADPVSEREPIPRDVVLREEVAGLTYSEWLRTEPVLRAEALGHIVEWDPPSGLSSASRWTCTNRRCGAAVLEYNGNIYGSAVEKTCEQIEERNVALGLVSPLSDGSTGGTA